MWSHTPVTKKHLQPSALQSVCVLLTPRVVPAAAAANPALHDVLMVQADALALGQSSKFMD